jgi:hypothetical protein
LNNSGSTTRSGNVLVGSPLPSDKKAKVPRLNNLATVSEEGDKDILSKSSNQPNVQKEVIKINPLPLDQIISQVSSLGHNLNSLENKVHD